MSQFPIEAALKPECDSLRADLLAIEKRCRALEPRVNSVAWGTLINGPMEDRSKQASEMMDHVRLAYRALEDARMRIGKVLQYARDGVSCFDGVKETP